MKKILSILICVVLGISSAWATKTTHSICAYAIATDRLTSDAYSGGTVKIAGFTRGDIFENNTDESTAVGPNTEVCTTTQSSNRGNSSLGYYYPKVKLWAYASVGYSFKGWTKTNDVNDLILSGWGNETGEKNISWDFAEGLATPHSFYAIFQPITVTGSTVNNISISDINTAGQGTVVFNVTNSSDVDVNDFDYNIIGEGFSIVNKSYSSGKLTVTVQYTSQTTDNVNGDPKPEYSASVMLTSKGGEAGAANKSQTATIKANISLVPTFTIAPTSYSFFDEYGIIANSESKTKTLTVTTTNNAAAASAYTYSLSDAVSGSTTFSGASNPYTIDASNPLQPVVKFTAPANGYYEDIKCTLTVYCTYTDAQSKQIVSETKTVTLTADAGSAIKIDHAKDTSHDFGTTIYGTGANTSLPFTATVAYTEAWDPSSIFTHSISGDKITVNVPADAVPGDYSSTLNFTYDGDVVATLAVSAQVRLAKPVLTATGGLGNAIQLDWTAVHGATKYIVKSGATEVVIIGDDEVLANTYKVTAIGAAPIKLGQEYAFTVTAIYDTENPYGTIVSDEVRVAASVHSTITSTTELDIWTGTDIFKAGDATYGVRPYRQKRKIDLTKAFDSNGTPLFDQLYIFGLTTNDDESMVTVDGVTSHKITGFTLTTNSNAVTPCFVYNKSGNTYVLDASKSIANVNVSTKPESFNIAANGQKIYFTGYAPYASCGSTWEENGVFYFSGDGKDIDIYLDNLQLYARYKTVTGTHAGTKSYVIHNTEDAFNVALSDEFDIEFKNYVIPQKVNVYAQGSGSAFCFQPKSNFSSKIHLSGDNVLESVEGIFLNIDVNFASFTFKTDQPVVQKSAPIQIVNDKNTVSKTTKLVIDDLWGSERTNGSLNLASASVRNAPTIDLGNENTELHINGGRITLSNSFPSSSDGKYTVSFAISYRKYSMLQEMANMYGLGSDQPGGKVRFNDGTINCNPLKEEYFKNNAAAWELYHNLTSMKCPQDTKIDGGTFNCDVLACSSATSKGSSPKNTKGEALCKYEIPVNDVSATGVVTELVDDWMNYAKSIGAKTNELGYYGISSMTPETVMDEDDNPKPVVYMMLPSDDICFVDIQTTPWVMCYPQFTANASGQQTALGGPVDVPYSRSVDGEGLTTIIKTSKFFYGEMDPLYMISSIGGYKAPGGMTVTLNESGVPETVENTSDYVVYDKMYMLIPLVANQWKMFVPPFDVSNIYVIESYPETKLIEDYGTEVTDKKGNLVKKIIDVNEIEAARIEQAYRYVDLFYSWVLEADVNKSTSDFWSNDKNYLPTGTYQSYGGFVKNWMDLYIEKNASGTITNKDYMPVIEQLYHYTSDPSAVYPTGKYWWDANFYLYKTTNKVVDVENDQLQMSWDEVPVVSKARNLAGNHNVIMKKGEVYVWSFPSTVVNNTMQDYTENWDYWTGKYILLEGYPTEEIDTDGDDKSDDMGQLIAGSDAVNSTILADINPNNMAEMRGNYTFAKANLDDVQNPFVLNNYYRGTSLDPDAAESAGWYGLLDNQSPHNEYVNAQELGVELTPGQGFILTNFTSSYGLRPRSINVKSGVVTYYDRDETTTSVPTIGGNKQMMVYNIEGGVGIVPVVGQQVSIYNAAGQLVTSQYLTDEVHIPLPSGIYLIAGAKEQFKVVVK